MNPSPEELSAFVSLLTGAQSALYGYIHAALANGADSADVLQETNRVLWKKAATYDHGRPFLPWAYRVAHFEILAFRKRQNRDRLLFNQELLDLLAEEYTRQTHEGSLWSALDACIAKLPSPHRLLLERRYTHGDSVAQIAEREGKQPNAVAAMLYRLRSLLAECLERQQMERDLK